MTDDYDPDDDIIPDPTDPDLDAFTNAAEGRDDYIEKVPVDHRRVRDMQIKMGLYITDAIIPEHNPLHIELLIAMGNIVLGVAKNYLEQMDLDVFQANKDQVQKVMGIMREYVDEIVPGDGAVRDFPTPDIMH